MKFQRVRIGDLGRVVTGRTPPAANPEFYGEAYPFITPTDIQGDVRYIQTTRSISNLGRDAFERILLPEHSVCVVCIGATIGKVCMTNRSSFTNQQVNSIVVNVDKYHPHYVFMTARLLQEELRRKAAGAATPIINKSAFENIEILVPDLTTQYRIASILSAYDDLIEVNQRRIAILEEMARRVFDEWFVRFRYPGHEAAQFVWSEDGVSPKGWQPSKIGELLKLSYGRALKSDQRRPGTVPVFGSSGVVGTHDSAMVIGPGIIVGRKGNVGAVHWTSMDFYPIDTVFYVETNLPLRWVFQLLKRQTFLNSDAAVPGLNREQALAMKVIRPTLELIDRYARFVEPLNSESEVLSEQNTRLRAARDLLLPKLISGEIDVSRAEASLAEAAE